MTTPSADRQLTRNDEKGRYEISKGDELMGYAQFKAIGDNAVLMPHTVVFEEHEGEGVGSALAHYALDDIRNQGKLVIPMCPFIAAYIRDHPEYTELVHPEQRGVFGL